MEEADGALKQKQISSSILLRLLWMETSTTFFFKFVAVDIVSYQAIMRQLFGYCGTSIPVTLAFTLRHVVQ